MKYIIEIKETLEEKGDMARLLRFIADQIESDITKGEDPEWKLIEENQ